MSFSNRTDLISAPRQPREVPNLSANPPVAAVSFAGTTLQVDATIVAAGLQLAPEALRAALHNGTVTSTCETGEGSDAGRTRVTFYSATRRMRLVVDATGTVLQRSAADFTRRPKQALQGALRSPAVPG